MATTKKLPDGWEETTVEEFLGLTPEESELVELRLALRRELGRRREAKHLTQGQLAELLGSDQAAVSRLEHGAGSVDLLLRALFALGADRKALALTIAESAGA